MDKTSTAQEFRRRALKKVTIGILGCLGMAGLFISIPFAGYMPGNPFMLVPACIPFVYVCIGVIELLTGRSYHQLADGWMALRGRHRGVIGTLIVLVGGFLIIIVVTALVMWFT
jgi:hypothetical protein